MPEFARHEAKDWARENWNGACNVIIPSFSNDLRALNEAGIRHDVRRNIELGFWGALLVSEVVMSHDEMVRFMEIAVDEAAGRQRFVAQLSFDTIDEACKIAQAGEAVGVDAVLLAYPNSFYPTTVNQVTEYTRRICEASDLGVVLFCAPHYNFDRLDPSGFPLQVWDELVDLDTVVALKYEVGQPGVLGSYEFFRRFTERGVLVCDPFEPDILMWADLFDVPWVGTSNYEYLGGLVPQMLTALSEGRRADAVAAYWKAHPARKIRDRLRREAAGANINHRYVWKYQAWLAGYNGGPLRGPTLKLNDGQMKSCSDAAISIGLVDDTPSPADFFEGRNPA